MKNFISSLFLILLFALSCDVYPQDEYEELYVVEAYLVAGRELPHLRLSTTVPADEFYSINNTAVDNAIVEIRLLREGSFSEIEQTFSYQLADPSIYKSTAAHKVLPLRTYELHITFPNASEDITAHTLVPDTFQIMNKDEIPDTLQYLSSRQAEITISKNSYPGRQNYYIFNVLSQNPEEENLIGFYRDLYENGGENPDDLTLLANSNSGIINEDNFEVNPDSSFTLKYPWLGFAFYGDNLLVANTIDDNVYDYIRSQSVQFGGTSPGEIQNVVYNIKGAVGVFGSVASDTTALLHLEPLRFPGF